MKQKKIEEENIILDELKRKGLNLEEMSGNELEQVVKKEKQIRRREKIRTTLQQVVLVLGGLLIALRLFSPPKYVTVERIKYPPESNVIELYPSSDFSTALLQALGIAVITGIIFYLLKRGKAK